MGEKLQNHPFGKLDANQRDLDEILQTNVDVRTIIQHKSFDNLLNLAAVIGKKGSGKTHLLLILESEARKLKRQVIKCNMTDAFADRWTLRAIRGDRQLEDQVATWKMIWKVSIAISTITLFSANFAPKKNRKLLLERAASALDRDENPNCVADYFRIFFEQVDYFKVLHHASPIDIASKIIKSNRNEAQLSNFLNSIDYQSMRREAEYLANKAGKVNVIIDSLDEASSSDPREWLPIQLALLDFCFDQGLTRETGRSIQLTVAIRTYIYSFSQKSVQADRKQDNLVFLDAGLDSARKFLRERLRRPSSKKFARAEYLNGENPLANWLGFETCQPKNRDRPEEVDLYLLRHTRFSPRQIIKVFNMLAAEQNDLSGERSEITESKFRKIIGGCAKEVGESMLKTAAEELIAYLEGPLHLYIGNSNGSPEEFDSYYLDALVELLNEALARNGSEVVSRLDLKVAITNALTSKFGEQNPATLERCADFAINVLWRSEIIAYGTDTEKPDWRFCWSDGERVNLSPPKNVNVFGLHSAMIDHLEIEASRNGPIFE